MPSGDQSTSARPEVFTTRAPKLGLVGSLDGLRAVAVALVVVFHLLPAKLTSFSAGVDIFFVVSGFLITTLLLQEHRKTGTISLRSFYARRGLRLLPPLYPVLGFTFLISLFVKNGRYVSTALKEILAGFFYVYHVAFTVRLDSNANRHLFLTHLWSLSVEEHFYLVIAVLVLVVIRRNLARPFLAGAAVFVVAGAALRATEHLGPFVFWLQRPDALLIGVVLAFANAHLPTELDHRHRRVLTTAGLVGLFVTGLGVMASTAIFNKLGIAMKFSNYKAFEAATLGSERFGLTWTQIGYTLVGWGIAPVILAAVRVDDWWLSRLLSLRWMQRVGRQSYAIYIWHVPILIVVADRADAWGGSALGALGVIAVAVGSLAVAFASHRYIEVPALRLKHRFASDPDAIDRLARDEVPGDISGALSEGP